MVHYKAKRPGDIAEVYSDTKKFNKILKLKLKYNDLKYILNTAYKWEKKNHSVWMLNRANFVFL